jgi:hypothetical protein
MATPFLSGVVALVQEAKGGHRSIEVNELRSLLINTANPVRVYQSDAHTGIGHQKGDEEDGENKNGEEDEGSDDEEEDEEEEEEEKEEEDTNKAQQIPMKPAPLDSIAKQGSGLVDVYRALKADTTIFPPQIRLNDASHHPFNNEYTFIIHNHGATASEYTIGHQLAASVQGYGIAPQVDRLLPLTKPVILDNVAAVVDIKSPTIHIEANQQLNVTVMIAPPANAMEVPPSIYSGFITVTKQEQVYSIPYAGFTADTSQIPVLMTNDTMPRVQNIDNGVSIGNPAVLGFQLVQASPLVTISVLDSNKRVVGLIPGGYNRFLGRSNIDSAGDAYVLPWFGNVANNTEQASLGSLHSATSLSDQEQQIKADDFPMIGSFLTPGDYRLKLAALSPFGNQSVETDYDVWISPSIEVKAPKKVT